MFAVRKMFFEWYSALMGFEKGREVLTELSYPEIASTVNACFFNGVDCRSLITKVFIKVPKDFLNLILV